MITYSVSALDMGRIQFHLSCLTEAISCFRQLVRGPAPAHIDAATRLRLRSAPLGPLAALVPPSGYVPDFLTPVCGEKLDLASEFELLSATNHDQIRDELAYLAGDSVVDRRWLAQTAPFRDRYFDDPALAVRQVTEAVQVFWAITFKPSWDVLVQRLNRDIRARSNAMEAGGLDAILTTLHPTVRWNGRSLDVATRYDFSTQLSGSGMALVPSLFTNGQVLPMTAPGRPILIYPTRPAPAEAADMSAVPRDVLSPLLGQTRAALLRASLRPSSTTDLAYSLGVSPGAVSQHARVLRDSGLLTTERRGKNVLHRCSPLGAMLLEAGSAFGG